MKARQEELRQRMASRHSGQQAAQQEHNDFLYPWKLVVDAASGRPYYYNEVTRETWEAPVAKVSDAAASAPLDGSREQGELQAQEQAERNAQEEADKKATEEREATDCRAKEEREEADRKAKEGVKAEIASLRRQAREDLKAQAKEVASRLRKEMKSRLEKEVALLKQAYLDEQERKDPRLARLRRRRRRRNARRDVMDGKRKRTGGGLTKDDLFLNEQGELVSRAVSERSKKTYEKTLKPWTDACTAARAELNITGFLPVNGREGKGKEFYRRAIEIYEAAKKAP